MAKTKENSMSAFDKTERNKYLERRLKVLLTYNHQERLHFGGFKELINKGKELYGATDVYAQMYDNSEWVKLYFRGVEKQALGVLTLSTKLPTWHYKDLNIGWGIHCSETGKVLKGSLEIEEESGTAMTAKDELKFVSKSAYDTEAIEDEVGHNLEYLFYRERAGKLTHGGFRKLLEIYKKKVGSLQTFYCPVENTNSCRIYFYQGGRYLEQSPSLVLRNVFPGSTGMPHIDKFDEWYKVNHERIGAPKERLGYSGIVLDPNQAMLNRDESGSDSFQYVSQCNDIKYGTKEVQKKEIKIHQVKNIHVVNNQIMSWFNR